MKAAKFHGAYNVKVEDVDIPKDPGPKQIMIEVAYCGICASDMHEYQYGPLTCPVEPHPTTNEKIPDIILGHEISGTICKLGSDVDKDKFHVGDKVAVEAPIGCGKCEPCKSGKKFICTSLGFVGFSGWGGGLSKFICLPTEHFHVLPFNVSLASGALVEPLAVAWHAVNKVSLDSDSIGLVVGAGPIGLFLVKILKARRIKSVVVLARPGKRATMAKEFGADVVIDATDSNAIEQVKSFSNGGCHVAFETAGNEQAVANAISSVRFQGTVVNLTVWDRPVLVDLNGILFKELVYTASSCYDGNDYDNVIEALSKGLISGAEDIITSYVKLEDVVDQGFLQLINNKSSHIKILVSPT